MGAQNIPPPPPLKNAFWPEVGGRGGGGEYNFSLDDCPGSLSWVLLLPRPPPSSRSLRLFPCASILLHGPLDICLDLLLAAPLPPMQKQDAQRKFLQHRGERADCSSKLSIGGVTKLQGDTMLGANLSDQIPGGPNLTLTLTLTLSSN